MACNAPNITLDEQSPLLWYPCLTSHLYTMYTSHSHCSSVVGMDTLVEYTSSEEEEQNLRVHEVITPIAGSESEKETTIQHLNPSPISPTSHLHSLVPFLANYSMNRKNLLSGFLLLPWKPLPATMSRLQVCSQKAASAIKSKFPELNSRYDWHFAGANRPVVFGRFGYTNVGAINSLHVSLLPNFYTEKHRFSQIRANLKRAVSLISPPGELLQEQEASAIDKMLLKHPKKKFISLKIKPNLRCYMSSKSGTVFVALDINDEPSLGDHMLAEYRFLRTMTGLAEEQLELLNCEYDWKTMVTNPSKKLDDGLPVIRYHVTLLIGEIQIFDRRLKSGEFRKLRDVVQNCNVLDDLKDMTVDVDTLQLRNIAGMTANIDLIK